MTVHILTGDSLKQQLEPWLNDEMIVARECLIDGDVVGETLEELYENRAIFIAQYPGLNKQDYYDKAVCEFNKIIALPKKSQVYCWFEDDLFCQVNFWFVLHLLNLFVENVDLYLVRPNKGNEYCFANMSEKELRLVHATPLKISSSISQSLAKLWKLYQQKNYDLMRQIAIELNEYLPFLLPAVEAQICRRADKQGLGYPENALLSLMKAYPSDDFYEIFRRFSQQQAIYGFGDIQVKAMYDRLKNLT